MARKEAAAPAVQLILGEDSYLAEEALEKVLAGAVGAERADAVTVIHGDEARWEQVIAAARTGSLFAARRAIVVRRADQLRYEGARRDDDEASAAEAGRKGKGKAEDDPVLRYLETPAPDATLVLLAAKPDRRRNPWKRLASEAAIHAADPKKGAALRAYVEQQLRARGLKLDPEAFRDLIEEVGQDLRRLMGEIDKLEAWADGRSGALSADDVHAVLGRGLARPLYLLADAVSSRDVAGGLAKLEELLDGGEEGLRILSTLHRALRQMRLVLALGEGRVPRAEIGARVLPANMQFKLDSLLEAARRWTDPDLRRALVALDQADRRLKGGADAPTTLAATIVAAAEGAAGSTSLRRGR